MTSFQTITLSPGRHQGPEEGVCVMELASMLAGERFSDRPKAVCPVIASFLRTYNDVIDDLGRRDLYPVAARVVGTDGGWRARRRRARLCRRRLREARHWAIAAGRPRFVAADAYARLLAYKGRHPDALAFVDELIRAGIREQDATHTLLAAPAACERSPV